MMNNLLNAIVFVALIATFLFASDVGLLPLSVASRTPVQVPEEIAATPTASTDLIWTPRLSD